MSDRIKQEADGDDVRELLQVLTRIFEMVRRLPPGAERIAALEQITRGLVLALLALPRARTSRENGSTGRLPLTPRRGKISENAARFERMALARLSESRQTDTFYGSTPRQLEFLLPALHIGNIGINCNKRLVARADVVIEGFRPGVMDVDGHDDRHDGAFGGTHDPHVRACGSTGKC